MSLYTEAAAILLGTTSETGSLRSVIYNGTQSPRKSQPASLYALITEAAKWDRVLKEIIDSADLLTLELKVMSHRLSSPFN